MDNRDLTQIQHRALVLTPSEVQPEARTVSLAVSSEEPVDRWFGREVLDHSSLAAIVMDRAGSAAGIPLLWGHDSTEMDALLGRVTDFELGPDRVLRGVARFATTEDAETAWALVQEGVLVDVSIGYRIHELTCENPGKPDEIQRATRWEPLEISLVSVPADATVGVGRDLSSTTSTPAVTETAPTEVRTMDTNPTVATPVAAIDPLAERQETLQIQAVAERLGVGSQVREILATVSNLSEARAKAMAVINEGSAKATAPAPIVDMGRETYSISRALAAKLDGRNCLELEVSQEIARKLGRDTGGFFVPTSTRANPPMDTATAAYGQKLVWTEQGDFISLLRNKLTLMGLGAQMLSGLRGNVSFPRQLTANTANWLQENAASAVTATALTTDLVTLTPKQLVSQTSVTRNLLAQANPAVDALINDDIANIHAIALETALINGAGSGSYQPLGILGTSNIGSVAFGTDGGVPAYSHLVDLETAVAAANADVTGMAYLTTPTMRGKLKQIARLSNTIGDSLWDYIAAAYPKSTVTNNVPSTLTKGGSGAVCHAILFGNFADLVIGEWGAFEMITDGLTQAGKGLVVLTSNQLVDGAVRRPASFAAMKDAKLS